MCKRCRELADPKELMEAKNLSSVIAVASNMMGPIDRLTQATIAAGLDQKLIIDPITVAATFGWWYHATMQNAIHDGLVTEEQFLKFNEMMMRDVKTGVEQVVAEEVARASPAPGIH